MPGDDDQTLEDVLARLNDMEARMDALSRGNAYLRERVEELEAENDRLREKLSDLSNVVDPDPGSQDYQSLTKAQKVHRIRRVLVEDAARSRNNRAAMKYGEVQALFGRNPSPGHAYTLMEDAGKLEGFDYQTPEDRDYRIVAKLEGVNDESLVHAANNATEGVGG